MAQDPAPRPGTPERIRLFQRRATIGFSCVFIVLGFVLIAKTAVDGGGIGFVIGAMFCAVGGGRLKLALRKPPGQGNGA